MGNVFPRERANTVFSILASLILPVAVLAPKGLVPLMVLAVLTIAAGQFRKFWLTTRPSSLAISLSAMTAIALITYFWSRSPEDTLKTAISLAATFFLGMILIKGVRSLGNAQREKVMSGILIGGVFGFLVLGIELFSDVAISRTIRNLYDPVAASDTNLILSLKPGNSIAAIYIWPWGLVLAQRYSLAVAVTGIAMALGVVIAGVADASKVALVIGAAVSILGYGFYRHAPLILGLIITVGILAMPTIPGALPDPLVSTKGIDALPNSAVHRLAIWQATAAHIAERPLLGSGFDTSRSFYSRADGKLQTFSPDRPEKAWVNAFEPIPLHPHNGILQVWLEIGLVGAVSVIGVLMAILHAVSGVTDRLPRSACLGALASTFTIALVSFGAWQSWWLAALFLLGAIMTVVTLLRGNPGAKSVFRA